MLCDYQENNEMVGVLIDQGCEFFLVNCEVFVFDMYLFIEVWDVEVLLFMSGYFCYFKKFGIQVMILMQCGDVLFFLDVLFVWC